MSFLEGHAPSWPTATDATKRVPPMVGGRPFHVRSVPVRGCSHYATQRGRDGARPSKGGPKVFVGRLYEFFEDERIIREHGVSILRLWIRALGPASSN